MKNKDFGMIGLGVMGQNFALNVERNGFGVAVFDINEDAVRKYTDGKAAGKNVQPAFSIREFVDALEQPRRIMLLVPAGKPVDSVIEQLLPLLDQGDLIIDGGNSYFLDTERRANQIWKQLLGEYEQPPIDAAIDEALRDYVARRKTELGKTD